MFRRSFKVVFVVLAVLAFSSAALALPPEDALSARPAESSYTVVRIDDLNGLLQYVFSQGNVEMFTSLAPDEADTIAVIAALAAQIPAKSLAVAAGVTADGPFVQVAASMPDSVRSKLDKMADGSATNIDIVTLLLGDAGMMFAGMLELEAAKGAKGPYYSLMGEAAFAAKDDLLLIAFPPAELEVSLGALEKKENRLSFKRRFDSPNYLLTHADMPTVAALASMTGGGDLSALTSFFKAPFELEMAFEPKQGSFLLSGAANILESFADTARYKDAKPVKGGNLFLAGGGNLLLGLSTQLAFKPDDLKAYPEAVEAWNNLVNELKNMNISASDMEDLLNGSLSIALGSDATVMGAKIPGGYVALTGRKGAAAKILETLIQVAPLVPLKVDGWNLAFAVPPEMSPVPLAFGVKNDTLFAGVVDSDALAKTPELPAGFAKTLDNSLFTAGVIDAAGIWNRLRQEVGDPNSLLSAMIEDDVKGLLNLILEADLSVPAIKIWSTEIDTAFMEFSLADVPQAKRLLPRLVGLAQMFMQ